MNRQFIQQTRYRLSFTVLFFGAVATALICRASFLQIIGDPRLEKLARHQFQGKILVKPRRGLIVDRSNEPLAINLETSSLAGSPKKITKSRSTVRLLARALHISESDVYKRFKAKKDFTWIHRHIGDAQMEQYRKSGLILRDDSLPEGLWLVREMKRIYPHGDLAAPLLGTVNLDAEGIEGAEMVYNQKLRGIETKMNAIRDALGRPAQIESQKQQEVKDGSNIALSIDASLQYTAENELKNALERTRSDKGAVVVMDAVTGEILAMAHAPTFNPNHKSGAADNRRLRAITDLYEPGSTIKPLLLLSALKSGRKITDGVDAGGGKLVIQGRTISEAEAHEKFGWITLKRMIEVSSNCAAAKLALDLGSVKFFETLRSLGLGQKTGISFPGEASGKVGIPGKKFQPLEVATAGFGHGITVTPIQMLTAYAAILNGGAKVVPTLEHVDGRANISKQLFSTAHTNEVIQALLKVTEGEDGTGKKARVPGYKIAGKTGTAQTVDPITKRYSKSRYITSFIGFPVGTTRKLVALTMLDHPRSSIYAAETAAPLFSAVMTAALQRFSVPSTEPILEPKLSESIRLTMAARAPAENIEQVKDPAVISVEVNDDPAAIANSNNVPSLVGLTAAEAILKAQKLTHKIKVRGFGIVRSQFPAAGSFLRPGSKVELILE